jgi:hypothetical protein
LFQTEECLLSLHSPTIAAHSAVLAHHTVTRDRDGHWVRRTRAGDRASRSGLSDGLRDLPVGLSGPKWQGLQVGPDSALERGSLDIEREGTIELVPSDLAQ